MGGLKGVGAGNFSEDGADIIVLLGIIALQFSPLLV